MNDECIPTHEYNRWFDIEYRMLHLETRYSLYKVIEETFVKLVYFYAWEIK
jgi:hypothetical protein